MEYLNDDFIKSVDRDPLWWQMRGLMYTASGFGKKIPTQYVINCADNRRRRVYCAIFSNIGTLYIKVKGRDLIVDDCQITDNLSEVA